VARSGRAFSDVVSKAARTTVLLSTDDFVADTACFGALEREKGKLRATVRSVGGEQK
jgi:hypothetical protein